MSFKLAACELRLLLLESVEVSSDDIFSVRRHLWLVLLQVVGRFEGSFGGFWVQLKFGQHSVRNLTQHLAILTYIELLQRVALIRYCSTPLKLLPVDGVNQSVVHYLS